MSTGFQSHGSLSVMMSGHSTDAVHIKPYQHHRKDRMSTSHGSAAGPRAVFDIFLLCRGLLVQKGMNVHSLRFYSHPNQNQSENTFKLQQRTEMTWRWQKQNQDGAAGEMRDTLGLSPKQITPHYHQDILSAHSDGASPWVVTCTWV